jgi:uncharacterized protein (DUF1501 family)
MQLPELTRRNFLKGLTYAGCCTILSWPQLLWASVPTEQRLLVVVLRGAMDGLGAIPAIGDRDYQASRGNLAFKDNGLLQLDGFFAMNAALGPFHDLYQNKELVILHATATPYRERSHFDAQDLLENGSTKPHYLKTGWLGRTVDTMGGTVHSLAIGPNVPLLLQGTQLADSWSPSLLPEVDQDFLTRVAFMYQADPLLSKTAKELLSGIDSQQQAMEGEKSRNQQFVQMMETTAGFMTQPNGARIASIDLDGWDTHSGQGLDNGRLGQALKNLSEGVVAFKKGMGSLWSQTTVLVITEFGRTVMANGSGGTDHGTGGAAFMAGGNVIGGRMIGDWPGLAKQNLYQGRDLYPTNDLRSLMKAVLRDHLKLHDDQIEENIFPDSQQAKAFTGLFKSAV